ncbi:aromatic ring-hydroxylating oxygenase subunit alpha [Leptolyngbya sp. 7M]|uniref:aromatic ring-hydroxylating oxygenase subunit alpha n=1 Tax=Leptolyngbya sp. 7M TaxID=2812896 RepID=UPI001B8B3279|nr:SRPBCC family protein [Leptolyngbya sp. 7M]QYO65703.1 Rieske 2Fe-2S domain-containing protein [Leptolyngbya sp. 7M]
MPEFTIDADIRRASTLPANFYTDEQFFNMSRERIFTLSWHLVGTQDEVRNLKPVTLLEDFLDEPLLLVENKGAIKCFSNVCTHRGKILVDEPCLAGLIRCGYHGRRFSLDGKFVSMPEFEGVENFPSVADDLPQIPLERWGRFLFSSISPAAPLNEFLGPVAASIDINEYSDARLVSNKLYSIDAHWALYCENYLEGFHIPFVHHSLNKVVDYGTYSTDLYRYSSVQTGYEPDGTLAGTYLFIFPNLMFNFYPWGISVNIVRPVSSSSSVIEYFTYVSDDSKFGSGAGADLERVELEDEAVVESVQHGIRSRFYDRGRYSPSKEKGTHHFHRLIAEFLG